MNLEKRGFDGFTLKILALIFMTFDHIGSYMSVALNTPVWFGWIGRIAAPIFLFMTAEGFYHTSNKKKYITRLYMWSIIMSIGNILVEKALPHPNNIAIMNGMFTTMFLITFYLYAIEKIKNAVKEKDVNSIILGILMILLPIGASFISYIAIGLNSVFGMIFMIIFPSPLFCEGSIVWILLGIGMFAFRNKKVLLSAFYIIITGALFISYAQQGITYENLFVLNYQWMMILALPLILLYNGKKGKGMKYLFYVYYPVHVYILYILGIVLIKH